MPQQPPADDPDRSRRRFLTVAGGALAAAALPDAGAASAPPPSPSFEEANAPIALLQARMAGGSLASRELTRFYLERIASMDRRGPELRAYIELNPRALAEAEALDAERKAGKVRGPLHGIPIAIKDNIGVAGEMSTTAGCLGLEGVRVADAPIVKRLREAGVVILGKTNLSEWANFRSSNSVSGWSSRGGQTRNPYALERTPSGSSSGSAVAATENLCAAAIGSETDGSITSPAACNGLVGLKPTIGLVSRDGIIPISHTQDTAGPMARTVHDCALLMNAIAGADPGDAATIAKGVPRGIDFTQHLGMRLKGVRLGVGRQYFGANEKADAVIDQALAVLRDEGAILEDVEIPSFGKFDDDELEVLLNEFRADLDAYFARHMPHGPFKTLLDVIEYNARNAGKVMPIFGQDLMVKASAKGESSAKAYRAALAKCRRGARDQGIDAVVRKHKVEAIVALTSPPAWYIDVVNGDATRGGCTSMPAVAGYPHVTVPAGFARGLPVGISFFGPAFSDARLLGMASAFERATKARRAPEEIRGA